MMRPNIAVALAVFVAGLVPGVSAGPGAIGWWEAQREVTTRLMQPEASIAELVAEVSSSPERNTQNSMFKLCVLMRAGMTPDAIRALHELKAERPALEGHLVESIYYDACDHLKEWNVAKATVEVFAENITELPLGNRLLGYLLNSGWTVDEVDQWLAKMPAGQQSVWVKERLRFNAQHDRGKALVQELSHRVREHTNAPDRAIAFLDVLVYARYSGGEGLDLAWMTDCVRPELTIDCEKIASGLKQLSQWGAAAEFYQRAIDMRVTEPEIKELGMMSAAFVPPETRRAMYAAHTREGLARCLLELGRVDEAQRWMVEVADIRKRHHLGLQALFAGRVQAASGARTIEGRVREEEEVSQDNPEYWQKRAQYYRGRGEPDQEEKAFLKGLALPKPQPKPEQSSGRIVDWRTWLLKDYARFLAREERVWEAVTLLRREIDKAPASSRSSEAAARMLASDFSEQVAVEDKVLWRWLAKRPKWDYVEERLLWRMLENADREELDEYLNRAEDLAFGKEPSRASTLGWILNRMCFPERSIPLLIHALDNARERELEERTHFTLFESHLDRGDWKCAEEVFPSAASRLTPREMPEWYARIAVVAAKAGAAADALRIWRRVANLSPLQISGLNALADAGLEDELRRFYREMAKEMPSSAAPARALSALEEK